MRFIPVTMAVALSSTIVAAVPPPQPAKDPLAMDIAGVRLGMTLEEAEASVSPAYRCKRFGMTSSFADLVQAEVDKRRNTHGTGSGLGAVWQLNCTGPNSETLQLVLRPAARGMVVDTMDFTASASHVVIADVTAQVAAKYGRPTDGSAASGRWCGVRCVGMFPTRFVTRIGGDAASIYAARGDDARARDDAAVQAAADRTAPKSAKASF